MTDEQLLDRLRADLDDFVGEPGPAPGLDAVTVTSRRTGRSLWVMVGAAAATVAVVVGGLLVLTHDDAEAPLATVAPRPLDVPMPVPPTPAGWTVVEWGDVRLSLPPDLEPYGPGCTSEADDDISVVITCAARVVTVVTRLAGGLDPDRPITVRNGLSTQLVPTPDLEESSSQLLIGQTTSLVRLTGFTADEVTAIADTVGVSSFWRIGREPRLPVPDDWQTVDLPGLSFRVPADWSVTELTDVELDPDVCGYAGVTPEVSIGRGSMDRSTLDCVADTALVAATDGVRVLPDDDGPVPLANPFVSVVVGSADPYQVVRIGLAGDGTIGRTIFDSVVETRIPAETVPTPTTVPTTTSAAVPQYEALGTVIDTAATGPMLCFGILDSLPPQCGGGVPLAGWSWDLVADEQQQEGTTWLDGVWVRGGYDATTGPALTVAETRPATDDDVALFDSRHTGATDFSVPCDPPAGGWPARRAEWPEEQVATIPGYAGSWVDATQQVMTAKFTGDLESALTAVQQYYPGSVCVVSAQRTAAELTAIADSLRALSSVQVISTSAVVDAAGERVEAWLVAPNEALQRSLDEQYGAGTVRLQSYLAPAG